jgi:uncharacterized membrane protein YcgQ (UPF0703/DUF1980 family)
MTRFCILVGFASMFIYIHMEGNLNKYINTKYAYLSTSAIIVLSLLALIEFVRLYREEAEEEKRNSPLISVVILSFVNMIIPQLQKWYNVIVHYSTY